MPRESFPELYFKIKVSGKIGHGAFAEWTIHILLYNIYIYIYIYI